MQAPGPLDVRTCQGRELSSWLGPDPGTSFVRAEGRVSKSSCDVLFNLDLPEPANPLRFPPPCDFAVAGDYDETACELYPSSSFRCFECARLRGAHLEKTVLAVSPDCSEAVMLQVRGVVSRAGPLEQGSSGGVDHLLLYEHDAELSKMDALLRRWPPPKPGAETSR